MFDKIASGGNLAIRILTGVIAALWDLYRTSIKAFASYDLLKYRPNIEEDEPPYLDDLIKINPDTAAWVTIYGTNIDYPIFQGKTDMEYLNKDAYGKFSISGSIFMSVLNKKDFSDPYTLIYGHHMDNGSMFGDIMKFEKKKFFYNVDHERFDKEEGVLIMQNKVYNLHPFALLKTDAYNNMIYRSDKTDSETADLVAYLKTNAKYYKDVGTVNKVLAMSTCDNATTDGRTVLFCQMKKRTTPLPTREEEPLTPHRKAIGHPMAGAYWSLMNLICMLLTLYTILPVHVFIKDRTSIRRVFGKTRKELILRILLAVDFVSVIVLFFLTEDMHKPIQVIDMFTPLFILFFASAWLLRRRIEKRGQTDT